MSHLSVCLCSEPTYLPTYLQYLALGVDPDVADHDKRTALHLAASEGKKTEREAAASRQGRPSQAGRIYERP